MSEFLRISLATTIFIMACGRQTSETDSSPKTKPSASLDALPTKNEENDKKSKGKSSRSKKADRLPECPAIALHTDMDGCDNDDLAVQQQVTIQDEAIASQSQNETTIKPLELPSTTGDTMPKQSPPSAPSTLPPTKDPNVVEFRIKAATGPKAWNTAEEPVIAKIGQIIRIFNDDSITHRLHTNGAPCPHGQNIAPGGSTDCVVTRAYNSAENGPLYDHIAGTAAAFHLRATE